jgi:hypothetical protein
MVHYYLQQEPAEPITLTLLDGRGEVIQSYTGDAEDEEQRPPAEAGGNRFVWNMRYPDARGVSDYTMVNLTGPLAPPGAYAVELAVDGRTYRQSFEIVKDPRVSTTQQGFNDQFELLIAIRDKLSQTHDVVRETRGTREQVDAIVENAGSTPDARQIAEVAEPIGEELWSIEDELIQFRATGGQQLWNFPMMLNNKLASLAGFVARADARPTVQQHEVFNDLSQRVDRQAMRLQTLIETDVARLRRMAGPIP